MNVAITLPRNLIQDIKTHQKRYELRKKVPVWFDNREDYVAVVEKGTKRCPLLLKISSFEYYSTETIRAWLPYWAEKLCVPQKWLEDYIKGEESVFLWRIGAAHETPHPETTYARLKLKRNPQSYVYIKSKYL